MNRRGFVKQTVMGSALPFWLQSCDFRFGNGYPVEVHSDHTAGHLIMQSLQWQKVRGDKVEIAIVGGGLAGITAAYALKHKSFLLFELSDRPGGTAASVAYNHINICQGAHYDLDYPEYYGEEVLRLLEAVNIIVYQPWKRAWSFVDRQHIIPSSRRQQCFQNNKIRRDVIPEGDRKRQFLEIVTRFTGKMPLPTRLIGRELFYLNEISFLHFLENRMPVDAAFQRYIDYHMMDDYGGTSEQVSALAGIHYFACRPYYREPVSLFSPPCGNDYFVQKILMSVPKEKIRLNNLVSGIRKQNDVFELDVIDLARRNIITYQAERIAYCGQKHALRYIFPQEAPLFQNTYAPWMVINFVADKENNEYGYWQNEYLGENMSFMGFIDSSVQDPQSTKGKRIYTAYYCLKPEDKKYLTTIPENRKRIVLETQRKIEEFSGKKIKVEKAFVKVMGHAMAIPKPGFLFTDANEKNSLLTYAGVDNGRLPLLFEALDSGIVASRYILG